jgi:hypothetical protein
MSVIEVAIGPGREPGRYRVEVVRSPDGEASAVTDLDVDALSGRRGELEQAVLVSSVPTRKVLPEEQRVQEVGQALFRALLGTGEVAGRYRAAAAVADQRRAGQGAHRPYRQGVECDVQLGRNPRRVGQRRRDGAGVGLTHQDSGPSGPAHAPPSVLDKDLD